MKSISKFLPKFGLLFAWLALFTCQSQPPLNKDTFLLTAVITMLNQKHFLQKNLNENFYKENFKLYLEAIDRSKLLLLRSEVEQLREKSQPGKDYSLERVVQLGTATHEVMQKRIKELSAYALPLLEKAAFNFKEEETFEEAGEEKAYAERIEALEERWRKYLKNEVLARLLNNQQFLKKTPTVNTASFKAELKKAIAEVKKGTKRLIARYRSYKPKDYLHFYLNALALSYDEYSTYLPPVEKETFDIRMSGQMEGIGAQITQSEDGYIDVMSIVPGGASYRQKELEAGDVILKVGQGEETPVDLGNLTVNEALALIRGKKGTLVKLTVRKKGGELKVIPIVRDTIILEETYTKSVLVEKAGARFGYIYLPKFYRDFNNKNVKNSTGDVAEALKNFNREKAEGLILDLRNNGGGALDDAILMSGLFITKGPILQVKDRNQVYPPLLDQDGSLLFDKPMVVLINEYSASASEILAGALQDYGRAIVVGGEKSYGKGTVQTITSLNRSFPDAQKYGEDFGALKYTVQKFYRINGKSPQTQGVVPDIILPTQKTSFGGKRSSFGQQYIPPLSYSRWNSFSYEMESLRQKSAARVKNSTYFENIRKHNEIKSKLLAQPKQLSYSLARQTALAHEKEVKQYPINPELQSGLTILTNTSLPAIKAEEQHSPWFQGLKSDAYLNEGLELLLDHGA